MNGTIDFQVSTLTTINGNKFRKYETLESFFFNHKHGNSYVCDNEKDANKLHSIIVERLLNFMNPVGAVSNVVMVEKNTSGKEIVIDFERFKTEYDLAYDHYDDEINNRVYESWIDEFNYSEHKNCCLILQTVVKEYNVDITFKLRPHFLSKQKIPIWRAGGFIIKTNKTNGNGWFHQGKWRFN